MDEATTHQRVLAVLQQLDEAHPERTAFSADEVGAGTDLAPSDAETVLDELVEAGLVETLTAYWPDQGGRGLPPGGRLYTLSEPGRGGPEDPGTSAGSE